MGQSILVLQVICSNEYTNTSMRTCLDLLKSTNAKNLVYYEIIENMISAIAREKQLKGGSRKKKLALIEKMNPYCDDLYEKLL